MTIAEQVNTIERALGERMLRHAFSIMGTWVTELGLPQYQDRMQTLLDNYDHIFEYYLSADDPDRDQLLDRLTGQAYRLVDEVYADIRLRRGLSPQMVGFNPDNPHSVFQYFGSCVHLQEDDLRWFGEVVNDPERRAVALLAIGALGANLRECFNEQAMLSLIDAMTAEDEIVAQQSMTQVILLLAHYDVRVDFFPEIQEAFMRAAEDQVELFAVLQACIRLGKPTSFKAKPLSGAEMVDKIFQLMSTPPEERKPEDSFFSLPDDEREYLRGIAQILPETWVYDQIVGEDEERIRMIEETYLEIGHLEAMLDRLPEAEQWLVKRLRSGKANALDYLNYGHCCFLRGDRMMAFEYYCQARQLCDSLKSFYHIFRPDRNFLVERGIPVEQVYMMEDQIIKIEK
ncbi:MAG: hypothetical protein IK073_07935 [Paludibacteraceae bacterium]|nr:hypothetical protein [Paludibacteraceae bacterium]